jgi:hypothetical protein
LLSCCSSKRARGAAAKDLAEVDTALAKDTSPALDTHGGADVGPLEACQTWGSAEAVGQVEDPALEEISGLAISRLNPGVLWVLEDSGAEPVLTALDASGKTLGTLRLTGVDNQDWEDLALGPCGTQTCLWVGEFGDNGASRDDVALFWVEEPLLAGATGFARTAKARTQVYAYPEGPQNVEALVVDPAGQPHLLTKRTDGTSRMYRVPIGEPGTSTAVRMGTVAGGPVEGLSVVITGADLWPDGSRLIVRTYLYSFELDLGPAGLEAVASAPATQVSTAAEPQGEAIAYDPVGRAIWHVSEGVNPILYRVACED